MIKKNKGRRRQTGLLHLLAVTAMLLFGAVSANAATGSEPVAHRGYTVNAPENTAQAYKDAAKAGFKYIECDVQESKDGSFFMMHDLTVDRTTNGKGKIQNKTDKQIKALRIDTGKGNPAKVVYRIPTLKETLEICKNKKMIPVIHLKGIKNYKKFDNLCRKYSFYSKLIYMTDAKSAKKLRQVNANAIIMGVNYGGEAVKKTIAAYSGTGVSLLNIYSGNLNSKGYADLKKHKNITGCAWFVNDLSWMYKCYKNGIKYFVTDTITPAKWEKYAAQKKAETVNGKLPTVSYKTYVQKIGWTAAVKNGKTSGTVGQAKQVEGILINLSNMPYAGSITYRVHMQGQGWMPWKTKGQNAGITGKNIRIEALQIKLTGELAKHYDIVYRAHTARNGWMAWTKNGGTAGTTGQSLRVEAIEIKLVRK
ncbi:MAG: glycerophosphodiester phosphodiesterase family protein [Lachnospiraceae bacterium]|nr:glycerophosphodiester phosphodiesterase family protein [Lachnospiraceae bacterium]